MKGQHCGHLSRLPKGAQEESGNLQIRFRAEEKPLTNVAIYLFARFDARVQETWCRMHFRDSQALSNQRAYLILPR